MDMQAGTANTALFETADRSSSVTGYAAASAEDDVDEEESGMPACPSEEIPD